MRSTALEYHETQLRIRGPAVDLHASVTWPGRGGARRGVVICPPSPLLGGDMANNVTVALAREAAARGLAGLRFDYRNAGRSDDDTGGLPRYEWWTTRQATADYAPVLADLGAVLRYARRLFEPVAAVGYSFGSWVALHAESEPGLRAWAGVCAPLGKLPFERLADVRVPALLVLAEGDPLDPPPPDDEVSARFPAVESVRLAGADHFLLGEEERVTMPVFDFVDDVLCG